MRLLQTTLLNCHAAVPLYKQAIEITQHLSDQESCTIALRFDKTCDKRRYNLPNATNREIAAIIPGDGSDRLEQRDIVLRLRGGVRFWKVSHPSSEMLDNVHTQH